MKHLSSRGDARGFGLTELLVAVAIFLTIIGAITLVFTGSLRALRQAEQSQQIYEMVRGSMQVMERDLTGAFVSREHGDIYQFYGTPIGFTFVGLVKYQPEDEPNIARVTYVLRRNQDTARLATRSEFSEFVNLAGDPFFENDGVDNDFDGLVDEVGEEGLLVPSFSLIRYVERNRSDLETFPVDWDDPALVVDDPNPGGGADTLGELVGNAFAVAAEPDILLEDPQSLVGNAVRQGLCRQDDLRCLQEVEKAARRQVWIGMLAGVPTTMFDDGGTPQSIAMPDFFELNNLAADDYVLLENVAVDDIEAAFMNIEDLNSASNAIQVASFVEHIDELQSVVYNGQFFQYTEWNRGLNAADEIVVNPNQLRFWMDWRNINQSNNGIDDNEDGIADDNPSIQCFDAAQLPVPFDLTDFCDGTITCPTAELPIDCGGGDWRFAPGAGIGSPLSPRIPHQVNFRFRLFVEAPTIGAPDFERNFNFQLDIPSAFNRVRTTE